MENKTVMQFKKEIKLEFNNKNKRQRMQELQPVEFTDLIPPKDEKDSSDSEEETKNQRQRFFVKKLCVKSRKMPKDNDQVCMNPIIKDLIINQEENIAQVKYGKQDRWGFQSTYDFFKVKNQQQKD